MQQLNHSAPDAQSLHIVAMEIACQYLCHTWEAEDLILCLQNWLPMNDGFLTLLGPAYTLSSVPKGINS